MVSITFPDGDTKTYDDGVTPIAVAKSISSKLAERSIAARLNGDLVDLTRAIESDASIELVTKDHEDAFEVLRHSTSHVMAEAVQELWPDTKLAIGPSIADGFYYDFDKAEPFVEEDLAKIEKKMREIIKRNEKFVREDVPRAEVIKQFKADGDKYKLELAEDLADDTVSLYRNGSFTDLCRGPHLPSTGKVAAFKLLKFAGAYWRGDEKREQLQRIYGTAFFDEKDLQEYLEKLEEAEKRDHRKLGKQLDLYSTDYEIGAGLILWHPKGSMIRHLVEEFWREEHFKHGYDIVYTPHIASERIYEKSGHLEKFSEMLYSPMDIDGQLYRVKPMNCPAHIKMYKTRKRSYRELPLRWCELGTVYRYERSGVLHGMLRVRGFTQDDAHIFCTPEQLEDEIVAVYELADYLLTAYGYTFNVYLATKPEKYIGSDENWEMATNALRGALERLGIEYTVDPGEGVYYGPKVDIKLVDALGREWQGPTNQVDFNLPERFDVNYVASDNTEKRVVMVHRTVLGSMERFVGGLIEHYAGAFPLWLSPEQIRVIPITDSHLEYAREVEAAFRAAGLRITVDARNEKTGRKIRDGAVEKIPYMAVVGDKEIGDRTVALRIRGKGDLGPVGLEDAVRRLAEESAAKVIF
ncbi:MAG: threonine--tRNA ligase [Planctomycetota bacterium]|nr:MAG: threonine--tRNA ligase [Planctomycetota bacterium]